MKKTDRPLLARLYLRATRFKITFLRSVMMNLYIYYMGLERILYIFSNKRRTFYLPKNRNPILELFGLILVLREGFDFCEVFQAQMIRNDGDFIETLDEIYEVRNSLLQEKVEDILRGIRLKQRHVQELTQSSVFDEEQELWPFWIH